MPPNYKLIFSRSWNCRSREGMINSIGRYWIRWRSWIPCWRRFRRMGIAKKSSWNGENLRMVFRSSVFSKGLRLQKKTLAAPYVESETMKITIKLCFVWVVQFQCISRALGLSSSQKLIGFATIASLLAFQEDWWWNVSYAQKEEGPWNQPISSAPMRSTMIKRSNESRQRPAETQ